MGAGHRVLDDVTLKYWMMLQNIRWLDKYWMMLHNAGCLDKRVGFCYKMLDDCMFGYLDICMIFQYFGSSWIRVLDDCIKILNIWIARIHY